MTEKLKYMRLSFYTLLCSALLAVSCDSVHEFPNENSYNPYLVNVELSIDIDMNMESDTIFQTYSEILASNYDIRYIVDIYEADPNLITGVSKRVKRIVKTENSIIHNGIYQVEENLLLPAKHYKIIAWVDFITKGTKSDKYYNTDDLQTISIISQQGGNKGYNTTKDAFAGNFDMDLSIYQNQRFIQCDVVVPVKRPFAVYRIITTDIEKYLAYHSETSYSSVAPTKTTLLYNLFFPMGYNAFLFLPDNFKTNIRYTHDVTEILPQKEAILASDIVFVEDNTFYSTSFEIASASNVRINTINGLNINLKRNKLTIIRGEFLTKDFGGGSIGIDDGFDGSEIIINL